MTVTGKILVVDDHVALAENIAEILSEVGLEVVTASSAEDGLRVIERGGIGGLITDYRLPGRTGAQLIAELHRTGRPIPAIVMSAFTDDDTLRISRDAGALAVLAKPLDLGRLMSTVAAMGPA
jgi:two-component system nitrogen regulation response regulator GlnG